MDAQMIHLKCVHRSTFSACQQLFMYLEPRRALCALWGLVLGLGCKPEAAASALGASIVRRSRRHRSWFGATPGNDGLFTTQFVNPDLRTIAGWFRLRVNVPTTRQECIWSIEDAAPSSAYQLMLNRFQLNEWESHDRSQGGFLFAAVDLGWWFIAETSKNRRQRILQQLPHSKNYPKHITNYLFYLHLHPRVWHPQD